MAETGGAESSANFIKKHWEGWRGFYADRFAFLENYTRFIHRDKPLPSWSQADVDEFIASDAIHGPTLKTTRGAVQVSVAGSAIGAVTTGAFAWKYSKSPHGALLALGAGAVFGWTFSHEIANHWFQLYRLDTMAAQTKFMEWWEKKTEGR
ncbi:Succinate dehydrogenase subunit 6, mitochondrial-like protein [Drosera capensis]